MSREALLSMARVEMQRCENVIRDAIERGATDSMIVPASHIPVVCDLRGQTRGMVVYRPGPRRIRLNLAYFEAVGERYRQTVAHEYAHVVARSTELTLGLQPGRAHGPRWQALMRLFGYPTTRSSDYGNVVVPKARRVRRYIYRCVNAGHQLRATSTMHKRLQISTEGYSCAVCRRAGKPRHECGIAFDREEIR